jgi:hypothetical protein
MPSLDPVVLFFLLGLAAGAARADLRLPPAIYEFLTVLLLLTIGLKGGVELAGKDLLSLLPQVAAVLAAGITIPLVAYPVLRYAGRLERPDAASIAAHYGSVSVGTYAVVVGFLAFRQVGFEPHMPLLLALLEMPAIVVGILLARGVGGGTRWGALAREVILGKSVLLLLGGLAIGWFAGADGIGPLKPLFFDLFKGVLALFLLEMGLIASGQLGSLRRHGFFLVAFGILMPIASAAAGGLIGWGLGLSVGGTAILATLLASASYIAVPAAMRFSVPEANPTLSLTASLGVTFPFNILVGIPLYLRYAEFLHSLGG